jgi:predicted transcriptional regulator
VKAPTSIGIQFNEFQKQIIEKIREQPGIAQHEIVTILGLSQQVVSYNLTKLTRDNILTIKKEGRENKYYINYIEQTTTKIQVDNQTQPMPVQQ